MKKFRLKVNDKVMVIAGKDKGKIGVIKKILKKKDRVIVEGVNIVKKHVKPNPYTNTPGGIQEKEAPIHYSNVMLVCEACSQPTRVGYKFTEDGKKMRYCKKCNHMFE